MMAETIKTTNSSNPIAIESDFLDIVSTGPTSGDPEHSFEERKVILLPAVERIFQQRSYEQLAIETAIRFGWRYEDKSEEEKNSNLRMDAYRLGKRERTEDVLNYIAIKSMSVEEAPIWLEEAYEVATLITTPELGTDWRSVQSILEYADDISDIDQLSELATIWRNTVMPDTSPNQVVERQTDFFKLLKDLAGKNRFPRPDKRSHEEIDQLFNACVELYRVGYSAPYSEEDGRKVFTEPVVRITQAGLEWHNAEQIRVGAKLLESVISEKDQNIALKFMNQVSTYIRNHEIDEEFAEALKNNLLPAMKRRDPQVAILIRGGNISGMGQGDYGVLDFIVASYGSEISAEKINELLFISREIPTSNLGKLERNRNDALSLASRFGILRDFIHDQRPGVHEVVEAVVNYYENGNSEGLLKAIANTDYLDSDETRIKLLDLTLYDQFVDRKDLGILDEKIIDIFRRLEVNTRPVVERAPELSNREISEALNSLELDPINSQSIETALTQINTSLIIRMGESRGLEPNEILAIGWLDQVLFKKLQSMTFETQTGAYKQEWFKQLLLFQEITGNVDFDHTKFESFVQELRKLNFEDAYKKVADRTIRNVHSLAQLYSEKGWDKQIGSLWSGNTNHELIGFIDLRKAETVAGTKYRNEVSTNPKERKTGD